MSNPYLDDLEYDRMQTRYDIEEMRREEIEYETRREKDEEWRMIIEQLNQNENGNHKTIV